MIERGRASWVVYVLTALLLGAIAAAVLVVGPASGQSATQTRVITAQRGVVQSTVSGSGNVAASSELDLGFKTSGTVAHIYVKQGQEVGQGQLVAALDPHGAEVTLEQAKANLQSAEAELAREEETDGESSSSSSPPSASSSPSANSAARAETATATTAAAKPPATRKSSSAKKKHASKGSRTSEEPKKSEESSESSSSSEISSATREANIASARAAVKSDRLTVENDERSVADTRLTAPESGTIVSLGGEVGETVSGDGTSRAASESSESSGGSGGGGGSSESNDSSQSNSSSSAFAVLSDLSSMKLVVPLSESEVGSVRRGQTATVTVEALKGAKLAAHVSEVAALPTSNSGVVSYDVTFALDQLTAGLKAGMSATAEVVVQQAEGVNVPTSAISGGSVTVVEGGEQVRRAVTTGLAGNSATIVLSGLKAGERVALPQATSSSSANLLSRLGSRGGGAGAIRSGLGGGGFAGGGFAGGGPRVAVGPGG
ncbi:MAG TPA: biotin/lipoyl-binding protein [Solirubrobacteraceae bacterium]|nr:biotin/lipoyl-binding protein [Solirubrobacteraceae bacterium]